ncbi:hypothetical protein AGMMS50296_8030 [Alphaproteobacteria bacterium]|nr:hypothetical protein AGMMS50296_8030 [Alphaproteobacteria bacterium]
MLEYDGYEMKASEIVDRIEAGREEGLKEGIKSVALSMLSKNLPLDVIATCTGLSEAELSTLRKS